MDAAIEEALEKVGRFVDVDRSYVFLMDSGNVLMDNTHEWCADGISSEKENLQAIPTNMLPAWMETLNRRENVYITRVSELPDTWKAERELLEPQNIQSLFIIPIIHSEKILGFVGFDSVREERKWEVEEMNLLRIFAELLANSIYRRNQEETLRMRGAYLRSILDNQPHLAWLKDREGRFLAVNDLMAKSCGKQYASDLIGMTDWDVWPEDLAERHIEDENQLMNNQQSISVEELVEDNGELKWFETYKTPVINDRGEVLGTTGFSRDITERKTAEAKLLETNRKLEEATEQAHRLAEKAKEASRAKSEFLANMSHEIRTPLNGILGMLNLLEDSKLSFEQKDYLQMAVTSSESLLTVINDILDFSKIEVGRLTLESHPFDLEKEVAKLMYVFASKLEGKSLELLVNYDSHAPTRILGDSIRIRQILFNLVGNAIKFTEEGHILVTVTQRERKDGYVFLDFAIEDTGIGIPEDKLQHIFEQFSQADSSTTRKYGGTGLGLAICRNLISLMGGELGVRSRFGEGSTFFFSLRFSYEEDQEELALDATVLAASHFLVVDDNSINVRIMSEYLSRWGIRNDSATSAREALKRIEQAREADDAYDMALIDYLMPEMGRHATGESDSARVEGTRPDDGDDHLYRKGRRSEQSQGSRIQRLSRQTGQP